MLAGSISTHILTRRMTFFWLFLFFSIVYFNSHPHEEDDDNLVYLYHLFHHFNSHPHEEDDFFFGGIFCYCNISTHILTRRMTMDKFMRLARSSISTHILTRRMTVSFSNFATSSYISTHILTRRMTMVQ